FAYWRLSRSYFGSLVVALSVSTGRSMLPSTICGVVGATGVIRVTRDGTSSSSSSLSVPDNICERLRSLVDSRNSLNILPSDDPISTIRFGPNTSSASKRRPIISSQCDMTHLRQPVLRSPCFHHCIVALLFHPHYQDVYPGGSGATPGTDSPTSATLVNQLCSTTRTASQASRQTAGDGHIVRDVCS